jgi:metal-sulfur cluster biosynthetic enzyme
VEDSKMADSVKLDEELVLATLSTINDPEIPVNIVELGLVYSIEIEDRSVDIAMTLTTPGCGMAGYITGEARQKLLDLEGVDKAEVRLVWDPPWNAHMISAPGRKKLGLADPGD